MGEYLLANNSIGWDVDWAEGKDEDTVQVEMSSTKHVFGRLKSEDFVD